jgi:hypothetical protein
VAWPKVRLHILAHEDRRRIENLLFGLGVKAELLDEARGVRALLGLAGLGELLEGGHDHAVLGEHLGQLLLQAISHCQHGPHRGHHRPLRDGGQQAQRRQRILLFLDEVRWRSPATWRAASPTPPGALVSALNSA